MSNGAGFKPSYNVALIIEDMAEKGWKPTHLARESGLADMTISRFLKSEVQTAPVAKAIAEALGRTVRRYLIRSRSADKPRAARLNHSRSVAR